MFSYSFPSHSLFNKQVPLCYSHDFIVAVLKLRRSLTNLTSQLKYSHVKLLIDQREDYITIKERLGHAPIRTTTDFSKQKETADKLDALF